MFAFAGLYEHWKSETGEVIDSCTIIVTEANTAIAPNHDQMSVILPPEAFTTLLDPTLKDTLGLKALLLPYPVEATTAYPVSQYVNSLRNDDPVCTTKGLMQNSPV